jgi:hypothetical protein
VLDESTRPHSDSALAQLEHTHWETFTMTRTQRRRTAFCPSVDGQRLEDKVLLSTIPPANGIHPIPASPPQSNVVINTPPPVSTAR